MPEEYSEQELVARIHDAAIPRPEGLEQPEPPEDDESAAERTSEPLRYHRLRRSAPGRPQRV